MPTQEESLQELLATLESQERDEEVKQQPEVKQDNSTIKQLRDHAKRLERELKKADEERAELRKFRDETQAALRQGALLEAGLTPRQAEVYLKAYDDTTP